MKKLVSSIGEVIVFAWAIVTIVSYWISASRTERYELLVFILVVAVFLWLIWWKEDGPLIPFSWRVINWIIKRKK